MQHFHKIVFVVQLFWITSSISFGSTSVRIITPPSFVSGDYLPVAVEFFNEEGKIDSTLTGTKRLLISDGTLSKSTIKVFRGMGSITPRITSSSGSITLTIEGFETVRSINVLSDYPSVTHSGTLNSSATWGPDKIHKINGLLRIPAGVELIISAGTIIEVSQDINIEVTGSLQCQGTESEPIHWTSSTWGSSWGGIELRSGSTDCNFDYTMFTDGGGDQSRIFVHSESQPVVKADHTVLNMNHCYFLDNKGKGVASNESVNYLTHCLFARCDIGAEFRYSNTFLTDVVTMFMPDENGVANDVDNDGIYFWDIKSSNPTRSIVDHCTIHSSEDDGMDMNRDAEVQVINSVFSSVLDKGISVSMVADLIISNSLIINCTDYGLALKEDDVVVADHITMHGNGTGFKIYGAGDLKVTNSIISQSPNGSLSKSSDSRSSITYSMSDLHTLSGSGNLKANPQFVNPSGLDFRLQENSPAIDKGNPTSPPDTDGTRTDMGAYPYYQKTDPITGIVINEAVGYGGPASPDDLGNPSDWIELYNTNDFAVNVGGLYLTDHFSDPLFYQIPTGNSAETTIPARGFLVLYADNQSSLGARHLGFVLSNFGDEIGLAQKIGNEVNILDQWSFPELSQDESYGRYPDGTGTQRKLPVATPGAPNVNQVPVFKGALFINEFIARYANAYPDEHGEYSDWIELYNAGESDLNVGGLYITDSKSNPTLHRITPGLGDSTVIKAKGFMVLRADNATRLGFNHLGFELASGGEEIALVQIKGGDIIWIDSLTYDRQDLGVSTGRPEDGQEGWRKFWTPTPGQSNQRTAGIDNYPDAAGDLTVYPNPFRETVTIRYVLNSPSALQIRITDLNGRLIRVLGNHAQVKSPGIYTIFWDGLSDQGQKVPSGIYFLTLATDAGQQDFSTLIKN
jgi:hypothetical protein